MLLQLNIDLGLLYNPPWYSAFYIPGTYWIEERYCIYLEDQLGIKHGDINKDNILIHSGNTTLIDFDNASKAIGVSELENELHSLQDKLGNTSGRGGRVIEDAQILDSWSRDIFYCVSALLRHANHWYLDYFEYLSKMLGHD